MLVENKYKRRIRWFWAICLSFVSVSCVNHIAGGLEEGSVPIAFSVKIQGGDTRIVDNAFESGDEAGLFAVSGGGDMAGERYIDNLRLVHDGEESMIPEREIFYPDGENLLDMYCYYPYQKAGMESGMSKMKVRVLPDQHDEKELSASDFLVAEALQIAGSPDPVELNFKHRFCKIRLVLVPSAEESVDELLEADPHIVASGFCTEAEYDFPTGTFGGLSSPVDIVPYGNWKKRDGCLVGKEFIAIPQANTNGSQMFTMDWNGKIYVCPMPEIEMKSNVVCEININAFQSTSHTLDGAIGSITDWGETQQGESDTQVSLASVKTAVLSFESSKVYRIYRNGTAVAEVCKEYLLSEEQGLDAQALVAYPVHDDLADLTHGVVLQLMGAEGPVHGGSIEWATEGDSFVYTSGARQPVTEFYINGSDSICLDAPEDIACINISSYQLRDIRNGELETYPIVKVGTQYWMGEDLRAKGYGRSNRKLEKIVSLGQAGYLVNRECYFYTGEALLAGEMAPYGWRIPTKQDWERLAAYVGQSAARLKEGTWKGFTDSDTVCPSTNETGLAILPNGLYSLNEDGKLIFYNWQLSAAYWIGGESPCTLTEESVMLKGNSNELGFAGNRPKGEKSCYAGLSIRCVME